MKKLAILAVAVVLACSTSCKCSPAARQAAVEIQDSHNLIVPEYVGYLKADPKFDKNDDTRADRERRIRLAESLKRLTDKLKVALDD